MQCLKWGFVCGSKADRDLSHTSTVSRVFIVQSLIIYRNGCVLSYENTKPSLLTIYIRGEVHPRTRHDGPERYRLIALLFLEYRRYMGMVA